MSDDDGFIDSFNKELEMADRRAHHNDVEKKRRECIKDNFSNLKDAVPTLKEEKVVSRAKILRKATDYLKFMKNKNLSHQQDIDNIIRQNNNLELQIKKLEKDQSTWNSGMESSEIAMDVSGSENSDVSDG